MRIAASLVVVLIAGTSYGAEFRTGRQVMGTVLQVTVIADDAGAAREAAEAAVREAQRWDDVLTTWRPDGELARLNRAAGGPEVRVSRDLRRALVRMLALTNDTAGAFDPGVGPLVVIRRTGSVQSIARPPSLRSSLRLDTATAQLSEDAGVDAGAIGKGIALDSIAALLRQRGARAAFVDFGGSSQLALGAPPDSPHGWTVAVTGLGDGVVHGTITVRDASLSTSRVRPADATEGAIVDPRNGQVVTTPRAVTVLHDSATEADAWSTALVVLGREGVPRAEAAEAAVFYEDGAGTAVTGKFRLDRF